MTGRPLAVLVAGALATAFMVMPIHRALACSCVVFTEQQAFDRAPVVFEGVVSGVPLLPGYWFGDSSDEVRYGFAVEEVAKGGPLPDHVEIATAQSGASCGAEFGYGERWRVFADQAGDHLTSGLCSGNQLLSEQEPGPVQPVVLMTVVGVLLAAVLFVGRVVTRG